MISELSNKVLHPFGYHLSRLGNLKNVVCNGDQNLIKGYLSKIDHINNYIVDIGANNGTTDSNTYDLFKEGYVGNSIEPDPSVFTLLSIAYESLNKVTLIRAYATPHNVTALIGLKSPLFVSLDIDGYDYSVLEIIMCESTPAMIVCEINEKIPAQYYFKVIYSVNYQYHSDHFYGMNITAVSELCNLYGYSLVKLNYHNAYLIRNDYLGDHKPLGAVEAYDEGYRNKPDRKKKYPWNNDMEYLLNSDTTKESGLEFINTQFSKRKGEYIIS